MTSSVLNAHLQNLTVGVVAALVFLALGGLWGIGFELSNRYRWAQYFGQEEWFRAMHCRGCSDPERCGADRVSTSEEGAP
jgi:hypothetical protein